MDISKINTSIISDTKIKSQPLSVTLTENRLRFNLMEVLPENSQIKDYNLSVFDANNKPLEFGLAINTNKEFDKFVDQVRLKGNVTFEDEKGSVYQMNIDNKILTGTNTLVSNVDSLSIDPLVSDEDVINLLLKEMAYLKTRVQFLEMLNNVS